MKVYLVSSVECTIDGVGLLEPGKPVEVIPEYFQLFHKISPAEAKFPRSVTVFYDTERTEIEEEAVN